MRDPHDCLFFLHKLENFNGWVDSLKTVVHRFQWIYKAKGYKPNASSSEDTLNKVHSDNRD
jgi:hypothetical protein